MTNDDAWRWLNIGLALFLAGLLLMRLEDPILSTLWGIALSMTGVAVALVGTGVLLRLWRWSAPASCFGCGASAAGPVEIADQQHTAAQQAAPV